MKKDFYLEQRVPLDNLRGRNDRFDYAKAIWDGKEVFVKSALSAEMRQRMKREFLWADFMRRVSSVTNGVYRGVGEIVRLDERSIMMPYVTYPHLVTKENIATQWVACLDKYVDMLLQLDSAALSWTTSIPLDSYDRLEHYEDSWDRWLSGVRDEFHYFTEAKTFVDRNFKFIEKRFQHGDLTPFQIFADGENWILYDGESCGFDLPRYYDLAYSYGRLSGNYHSRKAAATMLRLYIERSGVPMKDFEKSFMPVMAIKTVGLVADAYRNRASEDYTEDAERLLLDTLSGKLENLI